jgi:UDP-glucuronate decarboxylase
MTLMRSDSDVTGPINLGNPGEFTMKELAGLVIELTGSKSELDYEALPSDDPVRRCPDIGRAQTQLGWSPTVPLRDGLTKTISYFDDLLRSSA